MNNTVYQNKKWYGQGFCDDWTLSSLLEASTNLNSDRLALLEHGQCYTHGKLAQFSASLRTVIFNHSQPGDVVASLTSRNLSYFVTVQATMTSGRVFAPIDSNFPIARIRLFIEEINPQILLIDEENSELAQELSQYGLKILVIGDNFNNVASSPESVLPESTAVYVFTSGSSGVPKIVIRQHRDLAHAIYCFCKGLNIKPDDIECCICSPAHIGTLNDILMVLLTGYYLIPFDSAKFDPRKLVSTIISQKVNCLTVSPPVLRLLLSILDVDIKGLALRLVITSGSPLLRNDVARFFSSGLKESELIQSYGSTETGPMYLQQYTKEMGEGVGPLPFKTPAPGIQLDILNKKGELINDSGTGVFIVRSRYLAQGYLSAPSSEINRFFVDSSTGTPSFEIGDMGCRNQDGELYISGRGDRQINIYGNRFDLGEIEAAFLQHPEILEVVIPSIKNIHDGKQFAAVITTKAVDGISTRSIRDFLTTMLPAVAIPRAIILVSEMPLTLSGKTDMSMIDELVKKTEGFSVNGYGGPPAGSLENWIADVWQETLNIKRPGREEFFDDLGGDSLSAMEVVVQVEERTGLAINLDTFFLNSTISDQAACLSNSSQSVRPLLVTLKQSLTGPRVILIPGIGGHAWNYSEIAKLISVDCQIESISLDVLFDLSDNWPTRVSIAKLISKELLKDDSHRQMIIGGYSFGSMVACDLVRSMASFGLITEKIVLIDPEILQVPIHLRIIKHLRHYKQKLSFQKKSNFPVLGEELKLLKIKKHLRRIYKGQIRLPEIAVSMLLTEEGKRQLKKTFGSSYKTACIAEQEVTPYKHLELMQYPVYYKTAQWVEAVIKSIDETR